MGKKKMSLVHQEHVVYSILEFEEVLLKFADKLLVVLFVASNRSIRENRYFSLLNKLCLKKKVKFCIVEAHPYSDFGRKVGLTGTLPECRIYNRGKKECFKVNEISMVDKINTKIKEISSFNDKKNIYIPLIGLVALFTINIIRLPALFQSLFLGLSLNKPPHNRILSKRNSDFHFYVGPVPKNINITKITGSSERRTFKKPLTSNTNLKDNHYHLENSWRKNISEELKEIKIISYMINNF